MTKKKTTRGSIPKKLILLITLVTVIAFLTAIYTNATKNKLDVEEMRNSVLTLKNEFDNVSPGWTYDEYCRGSGSDVTRDNKKSCFSILHNDTDSIKSNYANYLKLLSTNNYTTIRLTESFDSKINIDREIRVTSYQNPLSKSGMCIFADTEYATPNDTGFYFQCSIDADSYYFERRD